MTGHRLLVPYPPVEGHGLIGDRLFAEEVETRSGTFLGNTPLLFSQAEYVRAVVKLAKAQPLDKVRLMGGMMGHHIGRFLGGGKEVS